jgi:DNA-binding transcriptional ArsR family regulator
MINKNISNNKASEKELYKAYKLFLNTMSSEQRLRILNLLRQKKMNVSEIQKETGFEQSIVSHNLRRLLHCGFIIQEIKGKYRYYKINEKTIFPVLKLIDKHMEKNCLMIIKGMKKSKRK